MLAETSHNPDSPVNSFALCVRVIPFSVGVNRLEVALIHASEYSERSTLSLPGGQLILGETLEAAAVRIASATLSTAPDYLEQLYTFSTNGSPVEVNVTYFALISRETRAKVERTSTVTFQYVESLDCLSPPDQRIVDYAKTRLRAKLGYSNVAFHLLPREFTLSDLQVVYESVLGEPIDKRNFRRRVLAAEIVESVGAKRPTSHRPATLYRFVGGDPSQGALTPAKLNRSA
jgi:8-oxo-dGTP diphosphatase